LRNGAARDDFRHGARLIDVARRRPEVFGCELASSRPEFRAQPMS
jgi:hypothetical protein